MAEDLISIDTKILSLTEVITYLQSNPDLTHTEKK